MRPSKGAWLDIIADILENSRDGENITSIMYTTRLSYGHMKEYLNMLTEEGLLSCEHEDRVSYRTTEKGFEYLETYRRLIGIVSADPSHPAISKDKEMRGKLKAFAK